MADAQNDEPLIQAPAGIVPAPTIIKRSDAKPVVDSAPIQSPIQAAADTVPTPPMPTPPVAVPAATTTPTDTNTPSAPADASKLESIRDQALEQLQPLLDQAEFDNAEKFDIYMRLIHASNDTSLLDKAHTAALAIEDPNDKAQALFDIVTEIDFQLHDQEQNS